MATDFGSSGGGGDLMQLILSMLGGNKDGGQDDVLNFINQGSKSPLLQSILQATLAALVPGEETARMNLTDSFRKAGAGSLRSGAYGRAVPQLEGELAGKRGLATAGVMGSTLGPILSALTSGKGQELDLLRMLMQMQSKPTTDPWSNIPPSQGLNTTMSGGGMTSGVGMPPPASSNSNRPLNLDELIKAITGGGGGGGVDYSSWGVPGVTTGSGLGSQTGWSNPEDFLTYGPWQDVE